MSSEKNSLHSKTLLVDNEKDREFEGGSITPNLNSKFFENLPEVIRPKDLAEILGLSVYTVYDWKYRSTARKIPKNLFFKFNRFLYIRTSVLKNWLKQQPNFPQEDWNFVQEINQ